MLKMLGMMTRTMIQITIKHHHHHDNDDDDWDDD